jgi:hypothetical protein
MSTHFKIAVKYDPSHLRALDLDLALAGHALADEFGEEVRYFREMGNVLVAYDVWHRRKNVWLSVTDDRDSAGENVRLAPLVVGPAGALFAGDEIEVEMLGEWSDWERETVSLKAHAAGEYGEPWVWRFAQHAEQNK